MADKESKPNLANFKVCGGGGAADHEQSDRRIGCLPDQDNRKAGQAMGEALLPANSGHRWPV